MSKAREIITSQTPSQSEHIPKNCTFYPISSLNDSPPTTLTLYISQNLMPVAD